LPAPLLTTPPLSRYQVIWLGDTDTDVSRLPKVTANDAQTGPKPAI